MKYALTKTTKADKITKLCTFDIETIKWTKPYATGFYDGYKYTEFVGQHCIKEFVNHFLSRKYRGFTCFAHNGGKFDFSFVLHELNRLNYKKKYQINIIRIGSRITQITIHSVYNGRKQNSWTLRDSVGMFKATLKKLTNSFKVKHLKGEFDHNKINFKNYLDLYSEWSPYLKKDCVGLFEVMRKFEDYNFRMFDTTINKNLTIAQLSLSIYRKKYFVTPLNTYRSYETDIRESYFGGRTEIFKQYGEHLNYYDINSLYPAKMLEEYMPVGIPLKSYVMTLEDFGVIKVEVEAPKDLDIPLLPFREEKTRKLIFPKGKWTGFYCTPELKKAKQLGYKIKIIYGYKFVKKKIFTKFVTELQKIKQNAERGSVDYMISKLIQNSLYGKFGQKRERKKIIFCPINIKGMIKLDDYKGMDLYEKEEISESNHILPAISSFIACYSRLGMYELIEEVQSKNGIVYYCDTDSIITDVELKTGDKLGELKDELDGLKIDRGIFILPKMYACKLSDGSEITRCKGFPSGMFNFKNFEKALFDKDLSDFKFKKRMFASPFESLRRNKCFVSMIDFSRTVTAVYDKRIISDDYSTVAKSV